MLRQYFSGGYMNEKYDILKFINIFLFAVEVYFIITFIRYIFLKFYIYIIPDIFFLGLSPVPVIIQIFFLYEGIFYQKNFSIVYKNFMRIFCFLGSASLTGILFLTYF